MELKSFSLLRWRTGRGDELVQVDPVCNTSGSSDESLHEVLKVVLPGIGNLDGGQLFLSRLLAMDADQRQSDISTTSSRRFLPFRHSTRDFIQSDHQGLKVVPKCRSGPE